MNAAQAVVPYSLILRTRSVMVDEEEARRVRDARLRDLPAITVAVLDPMTFQLRSDMRVELVDVAAIMQHLPARRKPARTGALRRMQ
jgi:hypothetical protein